MQATCHRVVGIVDVEENPEFLLPFEGPVSSYPFNGTYPHPSRFTTAKLAVELEQLAGDLKIEYDYTRTDNETRCVNILYIQATGSGKGPYALDISDWNELRKVPAMATYFNHMHAYHISYAAFPNSGENRVSKVTRAAARSDAASAGSS